MTARPGPIYLDYQATTPLDPAVLEAMLPYWTTHFGNPHSEHRFGWTAMAGVEAARAQVANLVGAAADWVIFTSGATEANNLALRGILEAAPAQRRRLVTVVTEHACVLETALDLQARGFPVTLLPVGADGLLDLAVLDAALGPDVALVSVMAVNNEIGVIQPLAEIARRAHAVGALVHSDAAQAAGKIALDLAALGLDLVSLSAHKCHGPKGVGALVARPDIALHAQMAGGGQERGVRSGTLAPALCVGFGKACALAAERLVEDSAQLATLWQRARERLEAAHLSVVIHGSVDQRSRANLNVRFPGVDAATLMADVRGVAFSSGAACASAAGKPSYVMQALGVTEAQARGTIRLGFGRTLALDQLDRALDQIIAGVRAQQQPLRAVATGTRA
jgi:cysteine desulfurase